MNYDNLKHMFFGTRFIYEYAYIVYVYFNKSGNGNGSYFDYHFFI